MELVRITAKNILGLPEDFEMEYAPGTMFLQGHNGKGKTSAGDTILYFALTGKLPDQFDTQKDLVKWGSEGTSEVVLAFRHGGKAHSLTRSPKSGSVSMTRVEGDGKYAHFKGATQVADELSVIMNELSPEALRSTRFVPQGSLTDVVDATPAVRKKMLQNLVCCDQMLKRRDILIKEGVNALPAKPDYTEQFRETHEAILVQQQAAAQAEESAKQTLAIINSQEAAYKEAKRILTFPVMGNVDQVKQAARQALENAHSQQAAAEQAFNTYQAFLSEPVPQEMSTEERSMMDRLARSMPTYQELALIPSRADMDARAGVLNSCLGDTQFHISARQTALKELHESLNSYRLQVELREEGVCRTCGTQFEKGSAGEYAAKVEDCLSAIAKNEQDLIDLNQAYSRDYAELREVTGKIDRRTRLESYLVYSDQGTAAATLAAFETRRDTFDAYNKKAMACQVARNAAMQAAQLVARCQQEADRLDSTNTTISPEEAASAKQIVGYVDALRASYDVDVKAKALAEGQINAYEVQQTKLLLKIEKDKQFDPIRDLYASAAMYLDKDHLPLDMIRQIRIGLNAHMKSYLQELGVAYAAHISEDLEFVVQRPGCVTAKAKSALSTGEKVCLGLAFRLAAAEAVSSGLSFFILDEPTAHLDTMTVLEMKDMLIRLNTVAKQRGWCIVVIDHHPLLTQASTDTSVFATTKAL